MDFQDIKGQEHVKRGLEVALAGNHGVLLISPKGNPDIKKFYEVVGSINALLPLYDMLPCPCGYFTDPKHECNCTPSQLQSHLTKEGNRLPLDSIAIHLEAPRLKPECLSDKRKGEDTATIMARIKALPHNPKWVIELDKDAEELLKLAILELGISARAYDKILAVSRTIATMDSKEIIEAHHISEAISYRSLDRNLWG